MADDKVKITADRVISRKGSTTKYYGDDGAIITAKTKALQVFDNEEELQAAVAEEAQAATEAEMAEAIESEDSDADEASTEQAEDSPPAPRARTNKRKGKKEQKMATSKKKAAKKVAKKSSNGALIRSVAGREHDISNYEKVKNASGHISYDNGDGVATKLRGKSLDETYAFAGKTLNEPEKDLRSKYRNLNPGMQRMALGNRLRKVLQPKAAA